MKNFVLILLCFGLFGIGFCDSAGCSQDDIDKILTCYKDNYVDLSTPFGYLDLVFSIMIRNSTKDYWQPTCDKKKALNDCLGNDRIQNCFNVKDLNGLQSFDNSSRAADLYPKVVVASFIEVDHICDKLFKFSDEDYNCYNNVYPSIEEACPTPVVTNASEITCESLNKTATCATETTYKECGKTVGCFEQKNQQLNLCFAPNSCEFCDSLSVANNQIDGICDDDNNIGKVRDIYDLRQLLDEWETIRGDKSN